MGANLDKNANYESGSVCGLPRRRDQSKVEWELIWTRMPIMRVGQFVDYREEGISPKMRQQIILQRNFQHIGPQMMEDALAVGCALNARNSIQQTFEAGNSFLKMESAIGVPSEIIFSDVSIEISIRMFEPIHQFLLKGSRG
uniref:Acyl-CoA_dh_1 domain-containing protein n=1 Tax=Ascaris lumbricoides TaxID=6252 RepID=A0A0M3IFX6_ASCLU